MATAFVGLALMTVESDMFDIGLRRPAGMAGCAWPMRSISSSWAGSPGRRTPACCRHPDLDRGYPERWNILVGGASAHSMVTERLDRAGGHESAGHGLGVLGANLGAALD